MLFNAGVQSRLSDRDELPAGLGAGSVGLKLLIPAAAILLGFAQHSYLSAAMPYIALGPADELALDQPRIAVEFVDPTTGRTVGPSLANTFLLDTGANGILAVDDAVAEMNSRGYRTEGVFFEQGVAGFTEFDVSAAYNLRYAGSDGVPHVLENVRILSSNDVTFCPVPGLCSFFGIAGMPTMDGRVTTMNLASLGGDGGGTFDLDDLLNGLLEVDFLETTFSDSLPPTHQRRYSIPVSQAHFVAEGEGPLPTWADLPFLSLITKHQDKQKSGNFVLDTGAQLSILSSAMAFDLGLDANGNGLLDDEAVGFQAIGGVGGQINAPLMHVDELRVPTEQGVELVYTDLSVAIVDIDPTIDGIFGMNFLSSGWTGSLLGDLGDLADLLNDAGLGDLLGELGGLGLGGGAPYGYFEKVHFDFREHSQGNGRVVLDLTDDVTPIVSPDGTHTDLDGDFDVDFDDRSIWVKQVKRTYFGDSNLDGLFNSTDMVDVFLKGEYEDGQLKNSTWASGDWNGDWEFDSSDFVLAFTDGGYELGPMPAVTASVPEPSGITLIVGSWAIVWWTRRRMGSC